MHEFTGKLADALMAILPTGLSPPLLIVILAILTFAMSMVCLAALLWCLRYRMTIRQWRNQADQLRKQYEESEEKKKNLEIRMAKILALFRGERRLAVEKERQAEEARQTMSLQFHNLAQQIFEEKTTRFHDLSRERLETILHPLHQELSSFKQDLQNRARHDSMERNSLKGEILQLKELNQHLNREASNLSQALKGNNKQQGNWGEMVLQRILECAGLRPGHEYDTQASFRSKDNKLLRPDLVIHLPENRKVLVDAKVSLVAWNNYLQATSDGEKEKSLADLCRSIRGHITSLSGKNYPDIPDLNSLDFVLMFLPVEASFAAAVQTDDRLMDDALAAGVIPVTPTTLLATLRIVANLWRYHRQNGNAREIARRASSLYDRFRLFLQELEKIGRNLSACQESYESAVAKLSSGRGNLISQAQGLRELGVEVKKEIPSGIPHGTGPHKTDSLNSQVGGS